MPDFVYDIPQTDLAFWFAVIAVGGTFLGLLFLKPLLRLLVGGGPDLNENIGFATASSGLFYGLLLGLLTVSAYQNRERVNMAIVQEAAAVGSLYADMDSYPEPISSDVKAMLRDYVLYTIYKDWPAHRDGRYMDGGISRSDAVRHKLASFEPSTPREEIVHAETIASLKEFNTQRQQRLNGVITKIPAVLWYAVLVGAAINILLLLMLKMRPFPHFVLGAINAFFLGVVLFVIVALDDPLRGDSGLAPEPFERLWNREMRWDEPQA